MGLTLHVRNFRAIKSADVELADLTVLAGVNASGKSTLVRLFHRLVCIEAEYEGYAANATHRYFLKAVMEPLKKVLLAGIRSYELKHEIEWLASPKWQLIRDGEKLFSNIARSLKRIFENPIIVEIINDPRFIESLNAYTPNAYFNVPRLDGANNVMRWVDELERFFVGYYKQLVAHGEGSSALFFSADIGGETLDDIEKSWHDGTLFDGIIEKGPKIELKISDGDVDVVDLSNKELCMGKVFSPRQSFYISQPSVDFPSVRMRKLRLNGIEYPIANKKMVDVAIGRSDLGVESIIGGSISAPKEKGYVTPSDWIYSNGEDSYSLGQCAEGIKSLATISILDRYKLLDAGALLIIDEPEVHLHPQWVVEMARVLVRLAKERNVKILITTHSPDLVHALRDFSESEGFSAKTCFYLARKENSTDTSYTFKGLGMEIGPIFRVFNRAKEQISEIARSIREG